MLEMNQLPEGQAQLQQKRKSRLVIIVFILVLLGIGGINAGIFFYNSFQSQKAQELQGQIEAVQAEIKKYETLLQEALLAQKQLENLDRLLNKRMYWSNLWKKLGSLTIPDVYYAEFHGKLEDRTIDLPGYARSYKALGQQLKAWDNAPEVEYSTLDSAALRITENFAGVYFVATVRFQESAWQE